jgi:hypothetical protein
MTAPAAATRDNSGAFLPHWPAPFAARPVDATITVPGSKSLTNRYLVLAALADGPSRLRAPLHSRDSALMIEALRQLGATITEVPGDGAFGPDLEILPIEAGRGTVRRHDRLRPRRDGDAVCAAAGRAAQRRQPVRRRPARPQPAHGNHHRSAEGAGSGRIRGEMAARRRPCRS